MCLITVEPEFEKKKIKKVEKVEVDVNVEPNRPVATPCTPAPPELRQTCPVPPHYVTCPGNSNNNTSEKPTKDDGRVTEKELLHHLLKCERDKNAQQPPPPPPPQQQQPKPRAPSPHPPPPPRPKEEYHYHHYLPGRGRRRSTASLVSVHSFESVRNKVRGLATRVGLLERDKERREWLAEAEEVADRRRADKRGRSRSPKFIIADIERFPERSRLDRYGYGYVPGRPIKEKRWDKEVRYEEW